MACNPATSCPWCSSLYSQSGYNYYSRCHPHGALSVIHLLFDLFEIAVLFRSFFICRHFYNIATGHSRIIQLISLSIDIVIGNDIFIIIKLIYDLNKYIGRGLTSPASAWRTEGECKINIAFLINKAKYWRAENVVPLHDEQLFAGPSLCSYSPLRPHLVDASEGIGNHYKSRVLQHLT